MFKKDIKSLTLEELYKEIKDMGAKTVMEVMQNIPGFVISESPSGNGSPGSWPEPVPGYL